MSIAAIRQGTSTDALHAPHFGALSDKEKKELNNDLKAPDLELLLQRQKKLFEDIKALEHGPHADFLDHSDTITLLGRLFEHSVEDGLKLAEQLKITPAEYAEIIMDERFVLKHSELAKNLLIAIDTKYSKIKSNLPPFRGANDILLMYKGLLLKNDIKKISTNISISSSTASKLLSEMDDIYSQYLRIREFQAEHPDDPRTAGERMAEELFFHVQNSGKYYKTRIIDAIYDNLVKNIFPAKDTYYSSKEAKVLKFLEKNGALVQGGKILNHEFIEPQIVNDIINAIKANKNNVKYDEHIAVEKIEKQLQTAIYKPLDLTFHMRNYLAEKQNKAEFEELLRQHYGPDREKKVQLVYDPKEGIYKIEPVKNDDKSAETFGKNVSEKATLEKSINIKKFNEIGEPKIINGKIILKVRLGNQRYMVSDDKNKGLEQISKNYDEISDFTEVGGKLYFTAKDGGIWKVINEDLEVIEFPIKHIPARIIDFNGKLVLQTREKDNEYIYFRENKKKSGPYERIKDIQVVGDELTFISQNRRGDFLNKIMTGTGLLSTIGPYEHIRYRDDRNTPHPRIAKKGKERYGLDKNRNEITGSLQDIHGFKKDNPFQKSQTKTRTTTKKRYIENSKGEQLSDFFDELYGPFTHNDQTIFIGKNGNDELQKRVINNGPSLLPGQREAGRDLFTPHGQEKLEKIIEIAKYDDTGDPVNINGKIVFRAEKRGEWFIATEDGKRYLERFDLIRDPVNINGKISFQARKGNKWFIATEDGKKIGEEFDDAGDPVNINGKIVFKAQKGDKEFIMTEDGKKIGEEFDDVGDPVNINGKIAFKAQKGDKEFIMTEDGKKIGEEFDNIGNPVNIDGKIAFAAVKGDKWLIMTEDGKKIGEEFDKTCDPVNINGKIAFQAAKGDKWFVMTEDGKKIGEEFDDVGDPVNINGKIVFQARKGDKWFVMTEDGKKIGGDFDNAYGPREQDGKGLFVGQRNGKREKRTFDIHSTSEIALTDIEQKKLDLLNLCVPLRERPGTLDDYKTQIGARKITEEKKSLGGSKNFIAFLNKAIKQLPQLFIDTMPAKRDKHEAIRAEDICRRIFPQAFVQEKQENQWYKGVNRNGGGLGNSGSLGNREPDPIDFLLAHEQNDMSGGDPSAAPKEIMQIRGDIHDLLSAKILESCNERGVWKKVYFPIDVHISGPQKITTITIPRIKYNRPIILAKPLNANVIPERVKGITSKGEEIDLTVSTNALNESTVTVEDKNIKEIVYSIEQSTLPPKINDITGPEYDQFKKQFIRLHETSLLDSIAQLDEEELMFLDSIKTDTPKQKLIQIEQYVRKHSFYDMGNKEVNTLKVGKSIDEKMYICSQRAKELQKDKKRAGVCADFANITAAMLRKAGFLSGVISGFMPSGSTVNTTDAHGVAYAVLPNEKGKNQLIIVDGTPHGSGNDRPSLQELETAREEQEKTIEDELEENLETIETVLERGDKDEIDKVIAKMYNGNLEDLLNIALKKEVRTSHYHHFQNLLNVYRYSQLQESDISLPANQTFIKGEMKREDAKTEENYKQKFKAGTLLFDMTRGFIDRFAKSSGDKYQALDRLDSIIDTCKDLLNTTEYKSMKIIIKYLRAENIKGRK